MQNLSSDAGELMLGGCLHKTSRGTATRFCGATWGHPSYFVSAPCDGEIDKMTKAAKDGRRMRIASELRKAEKELTDVCRKLAVAQRLVYRIEAKLARADSPEPLRRPHRKI